MAKRRLTLRQRRRIAATQSSNVIEPTGTESLGTIVARYGSQADIEVEQPSGRFDIIRCHIRANIEDIATGDKVTWCKAEDKGVIIAVHPRYSEITRPDARGVLRTIAANIDFVAIIVAPKPELHTHLLDRYLVAAENCAIKPLILCNKTDLFDPTTDNTISKQLAVYTELGYPVHFISVKQDSGITPLASTLANATTVLAGQSGVGKSSLINALCPESSHAVGNLSKAKAKGTHTTTTTRLCHLPGGGVLIDSPGIREFGLEHLQRQQVEYGFVEFRPLLGHCKFRNCSHRKEAGCAILAALAEGHISEQRMASYRYIVGG